MLPSMTRAVTPIKEKGRDMWYFAWLLGLPFAAAFAVLNAMWYELVEDDKTRKEEAEK